MKLTKKIESEVLEVYDTWLHSYLNGDVQTYNSYLDDAYHFIGSTHNEEFLNRKDTTQFFTNTAEQLAGKCDLRNEIRTIEMFGEIVFITHVFDAWFLNDSDYNYYGRFRFTNTLQRNTEGWRFIYQHFSTPDSKTDEGETIGFNKVNEENKELRQAIQRRTFELETKNRELQIEGALQRIRAQATAMQKSADLLDVVVTLRTEFLNLGHEAHYFWHMLYLPEKYQKAMTSGDGTRIGFVMELPRHIHGDISLLANWEKSSEPTVIYPMDTEEALAYIHKMVTLGDFQHIDPQAPSDDDIRHIGGLTFIMARTTHGEIGYSLPGVVPDPPPEDLDILVRFAEAFDLAHLRFLDLKKAEKQAREVQIELALEKVRSRTMAMQKSDELNEIVSILFEKMKELQVPATAVGIAIHIEGSKDLNAYVCGENETGLVITNYRLPYFNNQIPKDLYNAIEKQLDFFVGHYSKEEKNSFYQYLLEHTAEFKNLPEDIKRMIFESPSYTITMVAIKNTVFNINDFEGKILGEKEINIIKRFAKVFDQAYTRYLDLKKAEAQAKEAQIEAAVERVRSRTMGMQKSDELQGTALLLFQQMDALGIPAFGSGFNIWGENKKNATAWMAGKDRLQPSFKTSSSADIFLRIYNAAENGETIFVEEQSGNELIAHYKYMTSIPVFKEIGDAMAKAGQSFPTAQVMHCAYFSQGYLMFITHEPAPFAHEIFKRFAKVFEQTYTRFLDLQKAEVQTKETQVELALERVRARTMAMQRSEELQDAAIILFEQVKVLGFKTGSCGFNIWQEEEKVAKVWMSSPEGGLQKPFKLPHTESPIYQSSWQAKEVGKSYFKKEVEGKSLEKHFDYLTTVPGIKDVILKLRKANYDFPKSMTYHFAFFKQGYLSFHGHENNPETEIVFPRFAKVFEQTYTRFLDLQKAEAQAREAQIEVSLERVRSKAMAMRSSEDIGEATTILFKEIEKLEIETMRCGILIIHEDKVMDVWTTSTTKDDKIIRVSGQIDMTIHPLLENVYRGWKAKESHTVYELEGKDSERYYDALVSEVNYKLPTSTIINYKHYNNIFLFNEGALFFFTKYEIPQNALTIFKRFAKVFGLTYQRYRELIESERRENEARKQSSLDRVRGEIASMRSTEDLDRITPIIWHELTNLGVPFFRCGVFIMNEEKENIQVYLSDPNGKSLGLMNLDFATNELTKNSVEAWGNNSVFKAHWSKEEFIDWTKTLVDLGKIKTREGYQGGDEAPESLDLHFIPFKQGMLYVGNLKPLNEDQIELVKNLSESFSIAYARYEDFVKLEIAKEKVEDTLSDLKSTQKQLIQSEKMASLGELTAGIAHEIQNPLNFVNNFSEVSNELMDEMNEEIEKGDLEEAKLIANYIKQNLEKINHHGKRADAIVKGMLQHSRKSTAEKEPTDINKLAEEYLRLAYHGLRAKDKSFNAQLDTNFDENIGLIEVIPQDMGRVILNLITNAFYAVNEKKSAGHTKGYIPTVSVRTKSEDSPPLPIAIGTKGVSAHSVIISVKDNGNGMPKHVLDKIFQPFFTTKPTGEGTGLGLSMSYDIVKAHGGELIVETKAGVGSEFLIQLPPT